MCEGWHVSVVGVETSVRGVNERHQHVPAAICPSRYHGTAFINNWREMHTQLSGGKEGNNPGKEQDDNCNVAVGSLLSETWAVASPNAAGGGER